MNKIYFKNSKLLGPILQILFQILLKAQDDQNVLKEHDDKL